MTRRYPPMPQDNWPRRKREPVFIEHEPVINHPPEAWHHHVPWPYKFKWDGGWLFVLFLFAGGFAFSPLWLLAGFIAFLRLIVWCGWRFPLNDVFSDRLYQRPVRRPWPEKVVNTAMVAPMRLSTRCLP